MIHVGRLAPGNQWDQNVLERLFDNTLYPTGINFRRVEGFPNSDGCVLIVPGRYWHQQTDQITEAIARFKWVLAIRTGDEEDLLDIRAVPHPNIKWWVQTPRTHADYGDARFIPLGFPPHFNDLPKEPPVKDWEVFLSAQKTHKRRKLAFDQLETHSGLVNATAGFTRGLPLWEYKADMVRARVAPCPAGAASPGRYMTPWAIGGSCFPPTISRCTPTPMCYPGMCKTRSDCGRPTPTRLWRGGSAIRDS